MAVDFIIIASNTNASTHYVIPRADLPIVIVAPASVSATDFRIQCAVSSGASQAGDAYGDVQLQQQPPTISTPFTVFSLATGARPLYIGPIGPLPTPFIRLTVSTSATVTNTYTIMTGRYAS